MPGAITLACPIATVLSDGDAGGSAVRRAAPVTDDDGRSIEVWDLRDAGGTLEATIGVDAEVQIQFAANS